MNKDIFKSRLRIEDLQALFWLAIDINLLFFFVSSSSGLLPECTRLLAAQFSCDLSVSAVTTMARADPMVLGAIRRALAQSVTPPL